MAAIQFIFFRGDGVICSQGLATQIKSNSLVVAEEAVIASSKCSEGWFNLLCYPSDLKYIYNEVVNLVNNPHNNNFKKKTAVVIPGFDGFIDIAKNINDVDKKILLRFVYVYCLGLDNQYFSSLLYHTVNCDDDLFGYFEDNFLNPWPVARYADNLGLSVKQLNMIFGENYGMSAKKWLLNRRMEYARTELSLSSTKISEIAFNAGFSSHAHFTEAFKKYYHCSPASFRSSNRCKV